MKRFIAFTLAETLIVMGIIGIVSALTLPNLNASTGEKEKVAKVKKLYSNLNDAVGRAVAVYGPIDEWFSTDTTYSAQNTRFAERITEFMKVSKNCVLTTNSGCFVDKIKPITGTGDYSLSSNDYKFMTADGSSIAIHLSYKRIFVDIDGPNKGTGAFGRDVFAFMVDYENNSLRVENYIPSMSELLTTGTGIPPTQ